ncbi:MAG: pol protein, partial [Massilia sp.]|nr:pol protein [Massilia sp.]
MTHLTLEVRIGRHQLQAMLDSGAQGNFISPRVVNQCRLHWRKKERPYQLNTVEGGSVAYGDGTVSNETTPLLMVCQDQEELVTLDITDIADHDMILGIPWLKKHNPRIDWITGQLYWTTSVQDSRQSASAERDSASEQRPRHGPSSEPTTSSDLATEQRPRHGPSSKPPGSSTQDRVLAYGSSATFTKRMTPEESERIKSVPTEYWRYNKLFEERTGEDALPEHTQWDHEIPLEPGTQPRFHKVYPLNELQRRELKEYVQKALRKGHIRPSTSPAGHPILFVPKKNGELRMCV